MKKGILYFITITALLFGLREIHYHGLLKQKKGYYAKYKTAFLEKNNYDVLFLGSSRVEMHYDTKIFDSLTGKNSFNLSLAGATPRVAFAALKSYLFNSAPPEHVFYEIDYHFLKYNSTEIKEFNNYFPFLKNEILREEFNSIDSRINHFYYNPYFSFPYTGFKNLSTSLHGWLNIPNQTDSLYHKGYLKEVLRPSLNYIPEKPSYSYFCISERKYMDSIITLCKKSNIQITLVSSPIFAGGRLDVANKKQIIGQLKNIALINRIHYNDFSSQPYCSQRRLFIDHYHMNAEGARKYSSFFASFFNNNPSPKALK